MDRVQKPCEQAISYETKNTRREHMPTVLYPLNLFGRKHKNAPHDATHISQASVYYKQDKRQRWYYHIGTEWCLTLQQFAVKNHITPCKEKEITVKQSDGAVCSAKPEHKLKAPQIVNIAGSELRQMRKQLQLSANKLAKYLKTSHCTIMRLEQLEKNSCTSSPHYNRYKTALLELNKQAR